MAKRITVQDGNFIVSGTSGNNMELSNNFAINWLDGVATAQEMLNFSSVSRTVAGVGSVIANFEGTDGDRTYTGDDGRTWTFHNSTLDLNEITNVQAKFGTTSYFVGDDGTGDNDVVSTDVEAEYTAGDMEPGTRDWYVAIWIYPVNTMTGGNDYWALGSDTLGTRGIRGQVNNGTLSLAYDSNGTGAEDTFPTFGSLAINSTWQEIIFERVGNNIYCYLDGVQSGSTFDCTGDDIATNITGNATVSVGGSFLSGSGSGTPKQDTRLDAFEMRIGENLYGGVAPGTQQTAAPVTAVETLEVGDTGFKTQIDGSLVVINGAITSASLTNDQVLVAGASGLIETNADLTWDGATLIAAATGGTVGMEVDTTANSDKSYMGVWNAESMQYIELGVHGTTFAGTPPMTMQFSTAIAELQFLGDNGNHMVMRDISSVPHTDIPATTVFRLGEKAAAGTFAAAFGQLWVRSDDPTTLMYSDDAGTDFAIGGSLATVNTLQQVTDAGTTTTNAIESTSNNRGFISEAAIPGYALRETGATADEGNWLINANGDTFNIRTATDAAPNTGVATPFQVQRSGTAVTNVVVDATTLIVSDGTVLRVRATDSGDFVDMWHDTTDFHFDATQTGSILFENTTADFFTLDFTNDRIINYAPVVIQEQQNAAADTADFGQVWVRNNTPNTLFFTDDTGQDIQISPYTGTVQTTTAGVTEVLAIAIASGTSVGFTATAMGREDATGDTVLEKIVGLISNEAGTTALIGTPGVDRHESAGAATWTFTTAADNATDELTFDVTGEGSHTIDWKINVEVIVI